MNPKPRRGVAHTVLGDVPVTAYDLPPKPPKPQVGDTVELLHTDDKYTKLRPGARGRVTRVAEVRGELSFVCVDWFDGSQLTMIPDTGDAVRVVR